MGKQVQYEDGEWSREIDMQPARQEPPMTSSDRELNKFEMAVAAERQHQIKKGYTAEHDDERGVKHLINLAADYAVKREPVKSVAMLVATLQHLDRKANSIPGDHDELLAKIEGEIAEWKREPAPSGHLARRADQLLTILRAEQSARQAVEEQAIPVFEEANRLEAENEELRAEIGLMLSTRGLTEITAERDALQLRIDAAVADLDTGTEWWALSRGVKRVRTTLTAPTEDKEYNGHICFSGCRCGGQGHADEIKEAPHE